MFSIKACFQHVFYNMRKIVLLLRLIRVGWFIDKPTKTTNFSIYFPLGKKPKIERYFPFKRHLKNYLDKIVLYVQIFARHNCEFN